MQLPDTMAPEFKSQFSEEILKNVFNGVKRTELCLNEEDTIALTKDRVLSMDETSKQTNDGTNAHMKLKKTTILSGNHAAKRLRA